MGGSGADREVTRGTTEATLRTSSQWELSQDLGKLSETSLTDVDTALNPGEIYQEPKDTHETTDTGSKFLPLSINPEVDNPMWGATDMGGSGPGREVTRGPTKATLWTSSQWELSQDLGKLSKTSLADVDAALNPGEIYREPKDTHETSTTTKEMAEPMAKPEKERAEPAARPAEKPAPTKEMAELKTEPTKERAGPTARKTPAPTKEMEELTTRPKNTPAPTKEMEEQRPKTGDKKTPIDASVTPTTDTTKTPTAEARTKADAEKTPTTDATKTAAAKATKLLPLSISPEVDNPMWSATDMGGSGLGREVTRGTTKATLWTSSQWELSQDLGKLSKTSLADVDAALNPGLIYR
jgi:hypothetical protein